jgi:hypothetical protein
VTITLHDVAIARAADMASALDQLVTELRASGALKTFNQMFKARRAAAAARKVEGSCHTAPPRSLAQDVGRVARFVWQCKRRRDQALRVGL